MEDEKRKMDKRLKSVIFFVTVLLLVFLLYLFFVEIIDLNGYRERGVAIRNSKHLSIRGDILDRNGVKLATDELVYEVYAHPNYYMVKRPPEKLAHILSPYLKIPEKKLVKLLKSKKINTITLTKSIDVTTAEEIKKLKLREISVGTLNKRIYPQGKIASHLIGYYSPLSEISSGIENIANDKLSEITDNNKFQTTGNGQIIFDINTNPDKITKNPKGKDVVLTIDTAIQYICERVLVNTIKEKKASRGSIIVMDVKTGEILAWASYPTFDPNCYWKYKQENMKNWALTDVYPPGSTFKIITVASAMELGKINEFSKVLDTGKVRLGLTQSIENYDYSKHPYPGWISLEYLFEHSSNVGSANVALMMKPEEYYNKLRDFGFGQNSGIDLTAESIGILPKPFLWDKSRRMTMGYGYGASVTAIQMISAISAVANNGIWITPHVIKYSKEELANHVQSRRVISEENSKAVTRLLVKSISNSKNILTKTPYTIAAKTGTSRKKVKSSKELFTSAVGYFPASNPQLAVYVVIDSPRTGADWGSTVALPVLKEIIIETGKILNIKSDKK